MFNQLLLYGVGLLGGSLGLAAKKRRLADRVFAVDRSTQHLRVARDRDAIDEGGESLDALSIDRGKPTLAIVCTPVRTIVPFVEIIARFFDDTQTTLNPCLSITDIGSTKEKIVKNITDPRFIGSHPIAGSEKHGPRYADADLFANRLAIVTPTERTPTVDAERLRSFWEHLGSHLISMDAAEHDQILAATSHLPHLLSYALAAVVKPHWQPFCGSGYAGMTRLAESPPELWADIFWENREHLLEAVAEYRQILLRFESILRENDDVKVMTKFLSGVSTENFQ